MAIDYKFKTWDGEAGGNRLFWLSKIDLVSKIVDRFDLKPISEELIPAGAYVSPMQMMQDTRAMEIAKIPIRWPCGGIREPHLHLGSKLYMLDQKQWQEFSGAVINDCQQRLASAGSIGITQLIDISESVAELSQLKG